MRSLFRLYLYVVFTLMTLFAAYSLTSMLSVALAFTPLNQAQYGYAPDRATLTQSIVFAITTLLVAGAVGGVHYWLIRREQRGDPQPGASVIRALFLNITEGLYALSLTVSLTLALFSFAPRSGVDVSGAVAYAISAALVVALLEFERRRIDAQSGAASIVQRLHFYGVQLLLTLTFIISVNTVLATSERLLLRNTTLDLCASSGSLAPLPTGCYQLFAGSQWLGALFVVMVWGMYALVTRADLQSAMRQVFHVIGFSVGVILLLASVERALEVGLLAVLHQPVDTTTYANGYDPLPTLLVGAIVVAVYLALLRAARAQAPARTTLLGLILETLVTIFLAIPFWFGMGWLFYQLLRDSALGVWSADVGAWASLLALLIIGVGYIPLAFHLGRRSQRMNVRSPQRGFVLALLALGALTGTVSVVALLYTLATAGVGAPVGDWQNVARLAGSGALVGLALTGVYGWLAMRERVFARPNATGQEAGQVHGKPTAIPTGGAPMGTVDVIEDVLDEFAAHHLTREQAATRIRAVVGEHPDITPHENATRNREMASAGR